MTEKDQGKKELIPRLPLIRVRGSKIPRGFVDLSDTEAKVREDNAHGQSLTRLNLSEEDVKWLEEHPEI